MLYMFSSPMLEKGCRFPSLILGKGSIGSQDQYCDGFYTFPSPLLEKVSIGSPVLYWVRVVYVRKSNTGKRF